jgi:diguanylate cyclase (GGDEF)-like protein
MAPHVDLHALIERLVGDASLLMIFDDGGKVLQRFGAIDLLGGADRSRTKGHIGGQTGGQIGGQTGGQTKAVNLVRDMVSDDQLAFVSMMQRVQNGEIESFDFRARVKHHDGFRAVLDIRVEDLRKSDGLHGILLRATEVTETDRREVAERKRMSTLTLYRTVAQRLSLCPLDDLTEEIGNAISSIFEPTSASSASIKMVGPKGRGCRWVWHRHEPLRVAELRGYGSIDFSALSGSETQMFDPVIWRLSSAPGLQNNGASEEIAMQHPNAVLAATAVERWAGGMHTELIAGWTTAQSPDIEQLISELSVITHLFQQGLNRLATDAVASAERLRAEKIFQQLSDLVIVWAPNGAITYATPSFVKLLGLDPRAPLILTLDNIIVDGERTLAELRDLEVGKSSAVERISVNTPTLGVRTIEAVTTNLSKDLYVGGFVTTGRDMTETIRDAQRQARKDALATMVASISSRFVNGTTQSIGTDVKRALTDIATHCNVDRVLVWQNHGDGAMKVTFEHAAPTAELLGSSIQSIRAAGLPNLLSEALHGQPELCRHDGHGASFVRAISATANSMLGATLVVGLRNGDGLMGLLSFSASLADDGTVPGIAALESEDSHTALKTVSELLTNVLTHTAAQQALTHNATHDALTGLANRRLLLDRADRMLQTAHRRGNGIGLLFLDLDDFKIINDTLGHDAGDDLLREIAKRLRRRAHGSTVVARLGGDEFIVLIEASDPSSALTQLAADVAEDLNENFELLGRQVALKSSIGGVIVEMNSATTQTAGDLVRRADMAMYAAKHRGGNTFEIFDEQMEEQAQRRFNLHEELREAIVTNQLDLWYQPKVDLVTGEFCGCEALVRWNHPTKGFILPDEFISAAEQAGLIRDLGEWVFAQAVQTMSELRTEGLIDSSFEIAVNVSPMQLIDTTLVDDFSEMASKWSVPTTQIKIELTESTLAERDRVIPNLVALREAGFKTSIDDFGTGYSSLSYLRDLPLNELKIDRSFVMSIENDRRDLAMVGALIEMAHSLGLMVVAEGIETEGQRDLLVKMGCNIGQGWLFSKALPRTALAELLRQTVDTHVDA